MSDPRQDRHFFGQAPVLGDLHEFFDVPDEVVKRLAGVPKEKQAEEGINLAVEQIEELKGLPGLRGFHVMAIEWEEKVPEIVERTGLYPRPQMGGGG